MKAIRVRKFGEPEVMNLENVPDLKPKRGEVVVKMEAIGVNPVDTYIRAGTYPNKPSLPYTPGMDGAGIIKEVGAGIKGFAEGDRVYLSGSLSGSYAEEVLCHVSQIHSLPDKISFTQGAALGVPYATAYRALFNKAKARRKESVLIHGASGGVGLAAVQLAQAAGLIVIGTAGTKKGRDLVADQGAHYVLDHKKPDYLNEVLSVTDKKGVDIVLEMLANVNLEKDLGILAQGGRVVVIGCRGSVEINPRQLMSKETSIIGMTIMNASRKETDEIHKALITGLKKGSLNPIIARQFPLAQASQAHKAIVEPGAHGKIVLIP